MSVMLMTSFGPIVIDLHLDESPRAAFNFLKLCDIGYYDMCLFHHIQPQFIAQTGDPIGSGSGGSSIFEQLLELDNNGSHYSPQVDDDDDQKKKKKKNEDRYYESLRDKPSKTLMHDKKGVVAMASRSSSSSSSTMLDLEYASQFYITLRDAPIDYLDGHHVIFGHVAEDDDNVLAKLNEVLVDNHISRPMQHIFIQSTIILDDPFPPLSRRDSLKAIVQENFLKHRHGDDSLDLHKTCYYVTHGDVDDEECIRKREARSRAVALEIIGDLPHADIKPPENVLFICNLHRLTDEEDLEIILSRYAPRISSVKIIRDPASGESLCYGFIEFETQQACETAYFTLQRKQIIVNDRPIKVDFSQSVHKFWRQIIRLKPKSSSTDIHMHETTPYHVVGHNKPVKKEATLLTKHHHQRAKSQPYHNKHNPQKKHRTSYESHVHSKK